MKFVTKYISPKSFLNFFIKNNIIYSGSESSKITFINSRIFSCFIHLKIRISLNTLFASIFLFLKKKKIQYPLIYLIVLLQPNKYICKIG